MIPEVVTSLLRKGLQLFIKERLPEVLPLTMISEAEARFYTETVRRIKEARGAIVDLGCWMGGTSVALAKGYDLPSDTTLSEAEKVYAIDRFIWEPWMDGRGFLLEPGDNFLPLARLQVKPYANLINLIKADLRNYSWEGGKIKILLVDAMKNWDLTKEITSVFFPCLQQGSVLIHQDFNHFYTSWIHLVQYRLRDHFRVITAEPVGPTVAFELCAQISVDDVASATAFAEISNEEIDAAFEYSQEIVTDAFATPVLAAYVMCFIHLERSAKALEIYHRYESQMNTDSIDYKGMRQCLETFMSVDQNI